MTTPDPDAPIVIQESRWKAALVALGGAVFVATGIWMLQDPKASQTTAWFSIVFFGACGLIGLAQVFLPSTLTLDPSGFTVRQITRTWSARWSEVSNFRIQQVRMTRWVQFDRAGNPAMFSSFGSGGALPANWTLSPPELLELMNRCKARWGSGEPADGVAREPIVT